MMNRIFDPHRIDLDEPLPPAPSKPVTVGSHALDRAISTVYAAMTLAESHSQAVGCWHALRPLLEAKFGRGEGR